MWNRIFACGKVLGVIGQTPPPPRNSPPWYQVYFELEVLPKLQGQNATQTAPAFFLQQEIKRPCEKCPPATGEKLIVR